MIGSRIHPLPLDLDGLAVFFDLDGTLLDLADRPDGVTPPPLLVPGLKALAERLEGAVAVVTGRSLATVDALLPGLGLPVAGLHGAEWRDADGRVHQPEPSPAFLAGRDRLRAELSLLEGTIFEDKGAAIAAHYRLAPQKRAEVEALMRAIARAVGPGWVLQAGKAVVELRPAGRSKGEAVEAFLAAPFLGRRPIAFGDDLTDEAMFVVVNRMGGLSVRIGENGQDTAATHCLPAPEDVRAWIREVTR